MEAKCSPETYIGFQLTTRRYISKDIVVYNHSCEIVRYYKSITVLHEYETWAVILRKEHRLKVFKIKVKKKMLNNMSEETR
jgi:hypothetical protein